MRNNTEDITPRTDSAVTFLRREIRRSLENNGQDINKGLKRLVPFVSHAAGESRRALYYCEHLVLFFLNHRAGFTKDFTDFLYQLN